MNNKHRGSTLTECMVSLIIIILAVTFLLTGYLISVNMAEESDKYKDNSNKALSDIEEDSADVIVEVVTEQRFILGTKIFKVSGEYRTTIVDNVKLTEFSVDSSENNESGE